MAPNDDNVSRLRTALHATYEDETIKEITAAELCGDYPAVRYVPPAPGPDPHWLGAALMGDIGGVGGIGGGAILRGANDFESCNAIEAVELRGVT